MILPMQPISQSEHERHREETIANAEAMTNNFPALNSELLGILRTVDVTP